MTLDRYMAAHGLDAAAIAHQIGVSSEAVRKWLRGERIPRPEYMRRIGEITGGQVAPASFYEAVGSRASPRPVG
jgi:transcriptional regulator with XRE-family HTH domain